MALDARFPMAMTNFWIKKQGRNYLHSENAVLVSRIKPSLCVKRVADITMLICLTYTKWSCQ